MDIILRLGTREDELTKVLEGLVKGTAYIGRSSGVARRPLCCSHPPWAAQDPKLHLVSSRSM